MPNLIERQRRLYEVGIIRIGEKRTAKSGKEYPATRDTFRLTSANKLALEEAQKAYGGELRPWEGHPGEFELLTEAARIKVIFSTKPEGEEGDMQSLSQWWERWAGNTCTHRCDGCTAKVWVATGEKNSKGQPIHIHGQTPCVCDHEAEDFKELQAKGRACKLISRVSVILPEVPALGLWRLNTSSDSFDAEVTGLLDLIEQLGLTGLISMYMSIDWREKRTGSGEDTSKFAVVKLEYTPENFLGDYVKAVQPRSFGDVPPVLPPVAAPALPSGDDEAQLKLDAAHAFLAEIGMGEPQVRDFKAWCQGEGVPWVTRALRCRDNGVDSLEGLYECVRNSKAEAA